MLCVEFPQVQYTDFKWGSSCSEVVATVTSEPLTVSTILWFERQGVPWMDLFSSYYKFPFNTVSCHYLTKKLKVNFLKLCSHFVKTSI